MAQAIFKQWFVDFEFPNEEGKPYKSNGGEMVESELGMIPNRWKVGKLYDIANIIMGQSPKGSSYNETNEGEVFYQGRAEFGWRFPTRRLYTTEPKRMAEENAILMSVRAPVGDINVATEKCCIGRGLAAINSKNSNQSYLLYLLYNLKSKFNIFNGEGTVFGSINKETLNNIKIVIPPDEVVLKNDILLRDIDMQIRALSDENRNLSNMRDSLLPKLMSGEIRVPTVE